MTEEIPEKTRPNKSQMKREMDANKLLSQRLADLTPKQLSKLNLSDELVGAIQMAHRLGAKNKAYRRQVLYIARIVRQMDVEAIAHELEQVFKRP